MEITEESIIGIFEGSEHIRKKFHMYEILNALGENYSTDADIFSDISNEKLTYLENVLLIIKILDMEKNILNTEFSITKNNGELIKPDTWEEAFLPIAMGQANFENFEWLIELNLH